MKIKRVCEFCGKEFTAQTVTKRFCSTQCTNRSYKLRKRQEFVATYILKEEQEKKDLMKSLTKEVMTVRLAAEYLSIHPVTIYRYIRSGIIRAMHLPGKTLIKRADIDHLFETLGDIPERTHEFKEAKKPELTTVKETAQRYSISFPGCKTVQHIICAGLYLFNIHNILIIVYPSHRKTVYTGHKQHFFRHY